MYLQRLTIWILNPQQELFFSDGLPYNILYQLIFQCCKKNDNIWIIFQFYFIYKKKKKKKKEYFYNIILNSLHMFTIPANSILESHTDN